MPGASETYRIEHEGALVGALGVELPVGEKLPPGEQALVEELTAGVGLALWNGSLTADLQASVDRLRASRRRLVAIQDATRYSLERDLHDGVQQRLVAVKVRLSIARQLADKQGALDTATTLAQRCDDADAAIESLRDFARGVYPPMLELEGLRHALQARIDRSPLPIVLSCPTECRRPREVEAAVYFSVSEVLAAFGDSAQLSAVGISLVDDGEALAFEVTAEHGPERWFEPPRHVEDRIDALDGAFSVIVSLGSTIVRGTVPIGTAGDADVDAAAGEPEPEGLVEL